MGEDRQAHQSDQGRIAIVSRSSAPVLVRIAEAAGLAQTGCPPAILLLDARDGALDRDSIANVGGTAAVIVVLTAGRTTADADLADAQGATHWLGGSFSDAELIGTLRLADRVAAMLRQARPEPIGRRAADYGDADDSSLASLSNWLRARLDVPGPVSVAIVALTRFEIVNAAFGRPAGDALLLSAQDRILAAMAGEALVVRRTGATFAVAAAIDGAAMRESIERVDAALALPFESEGEVVNLGSRIGMAERAGGDSAPILLRRASEALAEAKASDGATTRMADMPGSMSLDRLAADLHHAIERSEIDVLFQPQVAMASGAIVGVEALARWDHPGLGSLGADQLFAAAERADLGIALSDHIQRLALERAAAWPAALDRLRLSLNVTAADIARPDFVAAFLARIAASGVARARVTAEIIETGLIDDLDRTATILARLRGAGCRIAIDDFGTGYSSLAYLKALPIDYLKIDRSLTRDITGSARDRIIVRGVIAIARSLGLETIAEGVETEEERVLLAGEGCDLYQGFLCSEPVGSGELVRLVG